MLSSKLYDTLVAPVYSEKATSLTEASKYTFKVSPTSTKKDVKESVEKIFGVKVVSVNIIKSKPKSKIFKGVAGKRSGYKKAIVTLESGKTIDLTKGA